MTKSEQIKIIKKEANSAKDKLLAVVGKMEQVSPAQAERLMKIVARIEDWQNA